MHRSCHLPLYFVSLYPRRLPSSSSVSFVQRRMRARAVYVNQHDVFLCFSSDALCRSSRALNIAVTNRYKNLVVLLSDMVRHLLDSRMHDTRRMRSSHIASHILSVGAVCALVSQALLRRRAVADISLSAQR